MINLWQVTNLQDEMADICLRANAVKCGKEMRETETMRESGRKKERKKEIKKEKGREEKVTEIVR